MPKIRNGAKALVVGNVVIRQTDGAVRSLQGSKVSLLFSIAKTVMSIISGVRLPKDNVYSVC